MLQTYVSPKRVFNAFLDTISYKLSEEHHYFSDLVCFAGLYTCKSGNAGKAELSMAWVALIGSGQLNQQFCKEQSADYPIMSLVARRLFCISASSAESERDLSSL
jgi:hypothetical protein